MKNNRILITGGAGYLGSMLATKLVSMNYYVTVVDMLKYDKNSLSHLFGSKNFKFLRIYITINMSQFFLFIKTNFHIIKLIIE